MKVADGDTDVFDAQQVRFLKHVQRVVHPLTRESRKMTDFFLRNLQVTVGTRIKLWVEKGCQTLRHAGDPACDRCRRGQSFALAVR